MNRKTAFLYLLLGTILFAIAPAVLKLLTTMGSRLGLGMPKAISFCNVLFVGNFCAGIITLVFYGPRSIIGELVRLPAKTKSFLLLSALIATLYPAFLFTGLERTSVVNVVLLSRFNGIVLVALGYLFLRTMVGKWELIGYTVMSAGVLLLLIVNNGGFRFQSGEWFILLSTVFFALTEVVSKKVLQDCSIRSFIFFRNLVSSIVFFVLAIYLFGFEHFSDAFAGELWILMLIYAGIGVVGAQLFWMTAVRELPVQTVANSQLLNPAFTILFAYLLLKETPGPLEWLVMLVIGIGIFLPRFADHKTWSGTHLATMDTALVGR